MSRAIKVLIVLNLIALLAIGFLTGLVVSKGTAVGNYDQGYCEGYLAAMEVMTSGNKGGDLVQAGICPEGYDD